MGVVAPGAEAWPLAQGPRNSGQSVRLENALVSFAVSGSAGEMAASDSIRTVAPSAASIAWRCNCRWIILYLV